MKPNSWFPIYENMENYIRAGIYPEANGKITNISADHRRIISCSTRWAYFPADWKHFWFSDGNVSCWERLQTTTYLIFQRPPHKREMFPPQRTAAASLNANLKFSISLDWASIEKSQLQFADRNFWNVNTMASSPTAFNHKIITRISHRVHTQYIPQSKLIGKKTREPMQCAVAHGCLFSVACNHSRIFY